MCRKLSHVRMDVTILSGPDAWSGIAVTAYGSNYPNGPKEKMVFFINSKNVSTYFKKTNKQDTGIASYVFYITRLNNAFVKFSFCVKHCNLYNYLSTSSLPMELFLIRIPALHVAQVCFTKRALKVTLLYWWRRKL